MVLSSPIMLRLGEHRRLTALIGWASSRFRLGIADGYNRQPLRVFFATENCHLNGHSFFTGSLGFGIQSS
jgi:hypothetical protein